MGQRIENRNRIGIFTTILLGLAAILGTTAQPTVASTASIPPPSAPIPTAAGPCIDKSVRYMDCGNGTVTDTATGLIWLKQTDCLSTLDFQAATKAVGSLKNGDCKLTDGSAPGDWRLPTKAEWEEMMKKALDLGCKGPTLTNDAGDGCLSAGPTSFIGVEPDYYWSSTPEGKEQMYFGDIDHGHTLKGNLFNPLRVWPVRGGQR
jgi:uncharacterized protein DUF1566